MGDFEVEGAEGQVGGAGRGGDEGEEGVRGGVVFSGVVLVGRVVGWGGKGEGAVLEEVSAVGYGGVDFGF